MPNQEKEKPAATVTATEAVAPPPPSPPPPKPAPASEDSGTQYFFGEPLVGFDPSEITGSLIVIEGMDGSGRSTQIMLLQEWLESEGFAVQTSGLRRSNLVGRDIDELLAKNAVTRLTLALMYATDFFDQVEHRILPALRSGTMVLADRYIFTLIGRGVVRGINRDFLAERPPGNRLWPRIPQGAGHQLLGSRARYVTFARSLLVLHPLSDYD